MGTPAKKLPQTDLDMIVNLSREGLSRREIARRVRRSEATISFHCGRAGIRLARKQMSFIDRGDFDSAVRALFDTGLGPRRISERLSAEIDVVVITMNRLGLRRDNKTGPAPGVYVAIVHPEDTAAMNGSITLCGAFKDADVENYRQRFGDRVSRAHDQPILFSDWAAYAQA